MTICIGFNFGEYVLLCADTRLTLGIAFPNFYRDDEEKIHKWHAGLITGAGLAQLTDAITSRLQNEPPTSTNEIKRIIREEQVNIKKQVFVGLTLHELTEWVERTGWFIGYTTNSTNNSIVRLAIIHPQLESDLEDIEDLLQIQENSAFLIMPIEATQDEAADYQATINKLIKPMSDFSNIDEHYSYHRQLCGHMVALASDKFNSVSKKIQLGVLTLSGQIEITDLIVVPETIDR